MKRIVTAAAALLAGVVPVFAQMTTPTAPSASPPATPSPSPSATPAAPTAPSSNSSISTGSTTPNAPVAGANSFTEGQARSRIESNGFTNLSDLKKDDQGIWRATATKDGKSHTVSVDYQGNVVAN